MHHAKLAKPVDGVVPGFPVVFSDGPLPTLPGAPTLGMHNQDILGTLLGLSDEQLQQLQMQGVV
jgi:crotonobetainyl-CoA:carnitine CoA-transferase CaiB-like acyl-CoA transferase